MATKSSAPLVGRAAVSVAYGNGNWQPVGETAGPVELAIEDLEGPTREVVLTCAGQWPLDVVGKAAFRWRATQNRHVLGVDVPLAVQVTVPEGGFTYLVATGVLEVRTQRVELMREILTLRAWLSALWCKVREALS